MHGPIGESGSRARARGKPLQPLQWRSSHTCAVVVAALFGFLAGSYTQTHTTPQQYSGSSAAATTSTPSAPAPVSDDGRIAKATTGRSTSSSPGSNVATGHPTPKCDEQGGTSGPRFSGQSLLGREKCDMQGLLESLTAGGATFHAALRVSGAADDAVAAAPRGVIATLDVGSGERLFSVPDALSLTARAVWEQAALPPLHLPPGSLRTLYLENDETALEYTKLAVALLFERRRGRGSPHWRYLSCLPQVCPALPCFIPAERDELQDAFAAEVAKIDRAQLTTLWELVDWGSLGLEPPVKDDFLWAFGMVFSRAFVLQGVPRLLPFVDLLNHHPTAGEIGIVPASSSASKHDVERHDHGHTWEKTAPGGGLAAGAEANWACVTQHCRLVARTLALLLSMYFVSRRGNLLLSPLPAA